MTTTQSDLLTREETASILRISKTSLDRLSDLPRIRIRRRIFIKRSSLDMWLSAHEQPKEIQS